MIYSNDYQDLMDDTDPDELPCPVCGNTDFDWGFMRSTDNVRFKYNDSPFIQQVTSFGGQPIQARRCRVCGNLQLFALD